MSSVTNVVSAAEADHPSQGVFSSPPQSNPKTDGSDSELSDLEEEDLGEVAPDHWSANGTVPVFLPSLEQCGNFERYVEKVKDYGMKHGIVKVIPPAEWKGKLPRLDQAIKTIKVKEPIAQDILGQSGIYRQTNIVHQRSYNLPQWRQLCEQSEHQPPARRGERRANQPRATKPGPKPRNGAPTAGAKKKGKAGRGKKVTIEVKSETSDRLLTPVSPSTKNEDDMDSVKQEGDEEEIIPIKKGGRQPKAISVSSRRKYNRREAATMIDEEAFKDFNYEVDDSEFTQERCDELERAYWKTLTYAPPLYGADMPGTLFDERTTTWNLGKLDNLLDVMGSKIPGVNTAYLYLGMWKATFAWHLEDVDLYSINFLHFGAPKQWYSISQGDARRFEAAMKNLFPLDAKSCDQFLRHKTFLISPAKLLQDYNIKVNKVVQHPGEFVITFPYGYHSGYNLGYNCAEAVNFALPSWLPYGRIAKKCDCIQAQDSVWIDVRDLERKMRGEETEDEFSEDDEEEDELDDNGPTDLPTPPESSGDIKIRAPRKKRKRPVGDKSEAQPAAKKIRMRLKVPTVEPCILCPNDIPAEPLLPTDEGHRAHKLCAQYIPETSVEKSGETEIVTDIKRIPKDRLQLRCYLCRSKKGACFQCSQKKCIRAYHATCAAAAGVFVEQGEAARFAEDGTEYKDWVIEFSCRFHRTKRDKKLDRDALGEDERILRAASQLKVGEVCQMQWLKGDIFAGVIVENRKDEEMILLDILPRGDRVEVEYKYLILPDPADYHLIKPSANAIPMPKSKEDKASLNTSNRHADDLPRADDTFVEGCTWAEFKHEDIPRNPAQVKIDFTKENQIWYYLGKTSTEARAQFTEDPAKPRHNPRGLFLDTIPKAVVPVPRQSYAASYPTTVNQQALNAARVNNRLPQTTRPPQPSQLSQSATPVRSEKPYVYKPRESIASYNIDPQAYQLQQNFLQRAAPAPYTFGTDPRYRQDALNSTTPAPYTGYTAPSRQTQPPKPATPATPQYRPPPVPKHSPFNGRTQSNSRPNPFAKYSYLQIEHNRSPLDYKTPYRPGGGFMNGYQGDIEKHLQNTLFQNRSSSGAPSASYGGVSYPASTSYSPRHPPATAYNSGPLSSYGTCGVNTQKQPPQAVKPAQDLWEKKETTNLHPAIRQEYNTMIFHHQDQPQRQPPTPAPQAYNQAQHTPGRPTVFATPSYAPATQSSLPANQQYQANPQLSYQTSQPIYPHQQYFQPPVSHTQGQAHVPQQAVHTNWTPQQSQPRSLAEDQFQAPNVYAHPLHDLPDVPADSTSLIEKMMINLRRAAAAKPA
ncbi:hypothetical protein B7494_g576 [Chlorociboria aeruginascens]|nr:hypothetical protein B7494_g576 [Chlorociboria aeruginascens]